jgi:hypothetical protein
MASSLQAPSTLPSPSLVVQAGIRLANEIKTDSQALAGTLKPNDIIDVTLIGHSRGAVVIDVAMQQLETRVVAQLAHGYKEMLLIDPHPANPTYGSNASFNVFDLLSDLAFGAYWGFEKIVHDPQVTVPPDVSYVKEWWQHSPEFSFPVGSEEHARRSKPSAASTIFSGRRRRAISGLPTRTRMSRANQRSRTSRTSMADHGNRIGG